MDNSNNPSSARQCWNWGEWFDLTAGFRLSSSGPRIGLAMVGVIVSWILLAILARIWTAFGAEWPLAGFSVDSVGTWWLLALHYPVFTSIAVLLMTAVWALAGGAIFRGQAVVYGAQRRALSADTLAFARGHWWRLFKAFLLPVIALAIPAVICIVNGLVLRIPWIGDIIGGLMLAVSIASGIWIAYVLVIWTLTAPLYGPAIGADELAAAECVTKCATYVQSRLVRTFWLYCVGLAMVVAAWWAVTWLCDLGLSSVHRLVDIGYGPWSGEGPARLDVVWPMGDGTWFVWDDSTVLMRHRIVHLLAGGWVLLLRTLICAWAVNLFSAMATITYFKLRAHVDGLSDSDVCGLAKVQVDGSSGI